MKGSASRHLVGLRSDPVSNVQSVFDMKLTWMKSTMKHGAHKNAHLKVSEMSKSALLQMQPSTYE